MTVLAERDTRQRLIVPPEKLSKCSAIVVGVGAVGRQVALMLAATGVPRLTLIDHDTVETVNLAPQGYQEADIGRPKVDATGLVCAALNNSLMLHLYQARFRQSQVEEYFHNPTNGPVAVFLCVDSIETRGKVWQAVKAEAGFVADGRMSAEVLRVLASPCPASDAYYETTLFAEEDAHPDGCTARSTIYSASIAAGMMVGQFTKWLRGLPVDVDVNLNLLSMELGVS